MGLGLRIIALGRVDLLLGDQLALAQRAQAGAHLLLKGEVRLVFVHLCTGGAQVSLSLLHLDEKGPGINLGDPLPLLDQGVEVHKQLLDRAGHITAHLHGGHRIDRARSRDRARERPAFDAGRLVPLR